MNYLIEKDGERQFVFDLDGCDGWTVLGQEEIEAHQLNCAKRLKKDEINAASLAVLRQGYSPTAGPLEGETLQLRDEDDKSNWLTSQGTYTALVAAGAGAVEGAHFRTASNHVVTMTYAEGLNELLGMAAWGAAVLSTSWTLKDAVEAAATMEEVEAVTWPV